MQELYFKTQKEKGDTMTNQKETGWNLRNSYAELPNIFFTPLDPNPVSSPKIVKFNDSLADL